MEEGDSILAAIKSTATNHGGRSNGFSVPNPNAQARLMEDNFTRSGIDPRTISYVESAANGSALGDPIEIAALNKVFRKFTPDNRFCAIGSAKSNIGHAEAASGMSQLTKVILQFRHKQLAPTIHADPPNPHLNLDDTPFYLQRELTGWKRPVVSVHGEEREFPRRATISSFGAGGSNAHMIIEEPPGRNEGVWGFGAFAPQQTKNREIPEEKGRDSLIEKSLNREEMGKGGYSLKGKSLNGEKRMAPVLAQITNKFQSRAPLPCALPFPNLKSQTGCPQIIVLSAKNEDRLKVYAQKLLAWLQQRQLKTEQSNEKPEGRKPLIREFVDSSIRKTGGSEKGMMVGEEPGFGSDSSKVKSEQSDEQSEPLINRTIERKPVGSEKGMVVYEEPGFGSGASKGKSEQSEPSKAEQSEPLINRNRRSIERKTLNPEPLNPEPLNPEPLNPEPLNPEPLNPEPRTGAAELQRSELQAKPNYGAAELQRSELQRSELLAHEASQSQSTAPPLKLSEIAYTLQLCREPMEERLALIATSIPALIDGLNAYAASGQKEEDLASSTPVFTGNRDKEYPEMKQFLSGKAHEAVLRMYLEEKNLEKLALFWVKGFDVPWESLYEGKSVRKISLPTYPFEMRRCWIKTSDHAEETRPIEESSETVTEEHVDAPGEKEKVGPWLTRIIRSFLGLSENDIKPDGELSKYGFDSLVGTRLINRIRDAYNIKIPPDILLQYNTIEALARYITEQTGARETERAHDDAGVNEHSEHIIDEKERSAPEKSRYPLSSGQKGLWFIQKLEPESHAYNAPAAFRIHGGLDKRILKKSFEMLIERRPILQTVVQIDDDGEPFQSASPEHPLFFREESITHMEESEIEPFLRAKAHEPFDLETGPLMRVYLFSRSDAENILLINLHHIIFDGTSLLILLEELMTIYHAEISGEKAALPTITSSYADFVKWQEKMLRSPGGNEHKNYWLRTLAGELPVLNLPTVGAPGSRSGGSGIYRAEMKTELARKLKKLAGERRVHPFTVLLSAYNVLLFRYTRQEDLIIGTPAAGRTRTEFEDLIGYFINMLPIRTHLSPGMTFETLVSKVHQASMDALNHQDYPFTEIVKELAGPRGKSGGNPVFQTSFTLQNWIKNVENAFLEKRDGDAAITLEPMPAVHQEERLDLELEVFEFDTFQLNFEYNSSLFTRDAIVRMADHFTMLLEGGLDHPRRDISRLPLLPEAERHRILVEWSHATIDVPEGKCIHHLFEEQVEKTPDATAVTFEDNRLTYRELNERANRLGHYLQALGVGPETIVGLCMERSIEMIVGLLGIVKAGGAYAPLDPAYPVERLAYMVRNTDVSFLLTQSGARDALPPCGARTVCLDSDRASIRRADCDNVESNVRSDNLVYVVHTSGTTGRPKGVMVQHDNLAAVYKAHEQAYDLRSGVGAHLQMANYSFDVFSADVFRALCSGGKLVLCPYETLLSAEKLYMLMREQHIDCAEFVPAVLRNLTEYLEATRQNLHFMKIIIVGSDAWRPKEHHDFQRFCDGRTRFINSYGVAEATIDSTWFEKTTLDLTTLECTPIGKPFGNIRAYILDGNLQPLPIGVPGELHIGGAGVARGYLNRPGLTNERFIPDPFPDPFSAKPGSRIYKTGDLCRWLPDGNIEFIGRIDHQVKIRGFRIELGEIESVLSTHELVKEAVVVAREDAPGDQRLAAYFTSKNAGKTPGPGELRAFHQAKLPDYMVPSAFVSLPALPLTPNGKIDRAALPAPDPDLPREHEFVAPRNETEEIIADIWKTVLNQEKIGVHDNFFQVGGNSLLGVRLAGAIEKRFDAPTPISVIFENSTIEKMSQWLSNDDQAVFSPLVMIRSEGEKKPFFCVHPVGGAVFCYAELARSMGTERPFYGLQSSGMNQGEAIITRIEDMADDYIEALLSVRDKGPYYLGGWSLGGVIAFEMARRLRAAGRETAVLALLDSYTPSLVLEYEKETGRNEDELSGMLQDMEGLLGKKIQLQADELESLDKKARLEHILKRIVELDDMPPETDINRMKRLFKVFTANQNAMNHYKPRHYPGKVVLLSAVEKPVKTVDAAQGWNRFVSRDNLEIRQTPGDHYTMLRGANVSALAEELNRLLAKE